MSMNPKRKFKIVSIEASMNPKGEVLKPDKDGYYEVNLGGLNVHNTSGEFYAAPPSVLNLFKDKKSYAVKRVLQKQLYGECEHPELTEVFKEQLKRGDNDDWFRRQGTIQLDRISHHIKSFSISETDKIAKNGKPVYLVDGKIKPHGPYKQLTEDALTNPNISAAFSVRSIVLEEFVDSVPYLTMIALFTWDLVPSPGILGSTDHGKMGYEMDEFDLTIIENSIKEMEVMYGNESERESKEENLTLIRNMKEALKNTIEADEVNGNSGMRLL